MKPRFSFVAFLVVLSLAGEVAPASSVTRSRGQAAGGQTTANQAEEDDTRRLRVGESITVTANRHPEELRNVGSSVTVITAEQIATSGARWLVDILEQAPGVSVVRGGPPGSTTTAFIRGANSNHTLFLIDGVKMNSPSTGGYDLAHLALATDQIERIEIVRGPQSPLYGSEAIGGVINIITRSGAGRGTYGVEAEGGSYSTGRFHGFANGRANSVGFSGGLSYFDSRGFSSASERRGNVEADGYRNTSYNVRVGYAPDNGAFVDGFLRGFDAEGKFDGFATGVGPIDREANLQRSVDVYAGVVAGYQSDSWTSHVTISDTETNVETDTPEGFFTSFMLDASIREIDFQNEVAIPGGQTLIGGLEYRRERAEVVSRSSFGDSSFDESVDVVGAYVHDRIELADLGTLSVGGRYEDHSLFGSKWTFRATGSSRLGRNARFHASVGSGFRAPSLNDLFLPFFGNPELLPEESLGIDLGLEAFASNPELRLDVTYFRNDIENLIEFGAAGFENLGEALTQGLEIGGDWVVSSRLVLAGTYTFTDAVSRADEQQLLRRPRHQGSFRATIDPLPELQLFAELRAKGSRFDAGPEGRVALDSYGVVNLAVSYEVADFVLLRGRVDNLLDAEYEELFGFGTAGLSAYVGVTLSFTR